MWDLGLILSAAGEAIEREAHRLDEEQATLGVDALDELRIHPLVRAGLAQAGFGVLAEQRYPAWARRPRRSEGDRCDIVLTDRPGIGLLDPLASGTLFGRHGAQAHEAFWMEVKVVGQYAIFDDEARANPGYSSGLLRALSGDVRKLSKDEGIAKGGALLALFNADEETARHDLDEWTKRAVTLGLPISSPLSLRFPISDRIGNSVATVALIETHRG